MSLSYSTYAPAIVQALNLKKATSDEYTGPCPNCGGKDRFRISTFHGDIKHHCRKDCDFIERNNELIRRGFLPKWENKVQPYQVAKQIPPLAAELHGNNVIIPFLDVLTNERLGQQIITPNGKKLFNRDLKKSEQELILANHLKPFTFAKAGQQPSLCIYPQNNKPGSRLMLKLCQNLLKY